MIDNGLAVNGDGHFFRCKQDSSSKVKIFHQYALSDGFKNAWINACEGIDGLEVSPASSYSGHYEAGDYHSYWATSPPLSPYKGLEDAFVNLSYIFANPDKKPYYPQTVFKIYCDAEDSNNLQGIRNVYVGQWDEGTMGGALQSNERWFNLFEDKSNDKEYLFMRGTFNMLSDEWHGEWGQVKYVTATITSGENPIQTIGM